MNPVALGIGAVVLALLGLATWKKPRLMGALLWSMLATVLIICGVIVAVPGDLFTRLIIITFLSPLVWVGLMFWCYYDKRQWRAVGSIFGLTVISTVLVITSGPLT